MENLELSVVIPTWKRSENVRALLASLKQCQFLPCRFETLVCTNFEDPDLVQVLNDFAELKNLRMIVTGAAGANASRNAGLHQSIASIICFIDDDCIIPDSNYLSKMVAGLESRPQTDGLGGVYRLPQENILDTDLVIHIRTEAWLKNWNSKPEDAVYLIGGNCIYRKSSLQKINGFESKILFGGTETDLNLRILKNGGRLAFDESLAMIHRSYTPPDEFLRKAEAQGFSYQRRIVQGLKPPERCKPIEYGFKDHVALYAKDGLRAQELTTLQGAWQKSFDLGCKKYLSLRNANSSEVYM